MGFKVLKIADGANITITAGDHNSNVNGSHFLIKNFDVKLNSRKVYDCNDANHVEHSPGYAGSTATNEFYYLNTIGKLTT